MGPALLAFFLPTAKKTLNAVSEVKTILFLNYDWLLR